MSKTCSCTPVLLCWKHRMTLCRVNSYIHLWRRIFTWGVCNVFAAPDGFLCISETPSEKYSHFVVGTDGIGDVDGITFAQAIGDVLEEQTFLVDFGVEQYTKYIALKTRDIYDTLFESMYGAGLP